MRRTRIRTVAAVLLGAGLSTGLTAALGGHKALARDHERDHNPRIHQALAALHDAQAELDVAGEDFHGHKREAQAAVQHAMDELDRIKDW